VTVASVSGRLESIKAGRVDLQKARWLEARTVETLVGIDGKPREEAEDLVASLVRLELLLRQAERAAAPLVADTSRSRDYPVDVVRLAAERLRTRLYASVRKAGLAELETSAKAHMGLMNGNSDAAPISATEPPASAQVRHIGNPYYFEGDVTGSSLEWSSDANRGATERARARWLFSLVLVVPLASWSFVRWLGTPAWLRTLSLAGLLMMVAAAGGLYWLAAGAGVTFAGWLHRAGR
jgi:hypothetical protein